MAKSNQQINKEAGMNDGDTSPAVISYRMSQVEKTVKEGFEKQAVQLEKIVEGFVTEKEMVEAKKESAEEHIRLWTAINDIKKNAKWWLTFIVLAIGTAGGLLVATRH